MCRELKTVKYDTNRRLELRQYVRQGIPDESQKKKKSMYHLLSYIFLLIPIKQLEALQSFLQNCSYSNTCRLNLIHSFIWLSVGRWRNVREVCVWVGLVCLVSEKGFSCGWDHHPCDTYVCTTAHMYVFTAAWVAGLIRVEKVEC